MSDTPQPRLHHLALTVADLDASVQWYRRSSTSTP